MFHATLQHALVCVSATHMYSYVSTQTHMYTYDTYVYVCFMQPCNCLKQHSRHTNVQTHLQYINTHRHRRTKNYRDEKKYIVMGFPTSFCARRQQTLSEAVTETSPAKFAPQWGGGRRGVLRDLFAHVHDRHGLWGGD